MRNLFKILLASIMCLAAFSCSQMKNVSVDFAGVTGFKPVSYKEFDCVLVLDVKNPTLHKAVIEDIGLVVTLNETVLGTVCVESVQIDKKSNKKIAAQAKIVLNDEKFSFIELLTIIKNISSYDLVCSGDMVVKSSGIKKKYSVKDLKLRQLLQKTNI